MFISFTCDVCSIWRLRVLNCVVYLSPARSREYDSLRSHWSDAKFVYNSSQTWSFSVVFTLQHMHVLIFSTVSIIEVCEEMICSNCWFCMVSQFLLYLRWIANVLCNGFKLYELDQLHYYSTRFTTNLCGRTCWLGVDWLTNISVEALYSCHDKLTVYFPW